MNPHNNSTDIGTNAEHARTTARLTMRMQPTAGRRTVKFSMTPTLIPLPCTASPAVADLNLVRSMLIARAFLIAALFGLTSCASTPVIYSDPPSVSRADIEIKTRWRLVKIVGEGRVLAFPQAARVEFVYLQFRQILELIAMGSLLANSKVLGQVQCRVQHYWNAKDLLKDIQAINPDFYPRPIVQKPSQRPGVKIDWLDRSGDYLTKDRFVTLYDKCGGILHAKNPFAPEQDYPTLEKAAPNWHLWILNLLNAHTIRLFGDPNIWLMQMGSDSESPTYTLFALTALPKQSH